MVLSSDAIIMLSGGLFVTGFLVTRGALELISLLIVPLAVCAVITMKTYFPPFLLYFAAIAITVGAILSMKGKSKLSYLTMIGFFAASVMVLKFFLPGAMLVRLSMTVIFVGMLKFLMF